MVVLKVEFKLIQECYLKDNLNNSQETILSLLPKNNQLELVLMFRDLILVLVKDKWPWLWTLIKISMDIEILTVPELPLAKLFLIWVLEEELNQLVWVSIIVLKKFYKILFKLKNWVSALDWKEKPSLFKVSVT